MSNALAVYHGQFGRVSIYRLNKPLATHAHREGHLLFLVGGNEESSIDVGDTRYALTNRLGVAVNPWQPHNYNPGDLINGCYYLILYINPSWFLELGRDARSALRFGRNLIEVNEHTSRLVHLVTSLLLEHDYNDLFDGYLFELVRECFDQSWQWCEGDSDMRSNWMTIRDFRIRKSIRLMKERIADELALDNIARDSGLSRPHFYKLFRQNIGLTPNIYLNTLRMETSIDRLTRSSEPITSIGLDLGFASQASFTRFFTSNVGIPPTDYRRASTLSA
jgi:AraC-like DNA-binding protein